MFNLATISRPYAIAVFNHANETNHLNEWADFLSNLANFSESSRNLVAYFESFSSQRSVLTESIIEAMEIKDQSQIVFLNLIQQSKRLSCMREICEQFLKLKRKKENSQKVAVESAFELTDKQTDELKTNLKKNLNQTIELDIKVNQDLIGGFVVRIDDYVIDQSIKAKLSQLKNELII